MIPPTLSTRAFKYLRKCDPMSGLQHTDEEVHEIGARLLHLCHVAADSKEKEARLLQGLLTEAEVKGLRVLEEKFAITGRLCSAREFSLALGYKSSRSGHSILHRLLCKGLLVKSAGHLVFSQKYKRCFQGDGELPVLENNGGKDGDDDLSLNFQCGASE
jgi:hypothetical protein